MALALLACLVEVLRREHRPTSSFSRRCCCHRGTIVVCVLERTRRPGGERARRVRALVTSARDARAYRNVLIVTMIVDALVTSAMNPCWLWKSPWPPPAYPGGSGTAAPSVRDAGHPIGQNVRLSGLSSLPQPPARAGAVHSPPPATPAAAGAAPAQPICFLFFYKIIRTTQLLK